jgi:molybdopterin/thiamine biosynthesis adenylyltransferase
MTTFRHDTQLLRQQSAMVVGVGGLGCPAALSLVRAGVGRVVLVDDDLVEASNLHRQILFSDADVGKDKLDAARRVLLGRGGTERGIELVRSRLLPENARELVRSVDVVLEGADNFATKFLAADACRLERRPVVHAAAIRWTATIWAVGAAGRPCYRCLFEDLPGGAQQGCDEAGVLGPVVGLAGALAADLALRILADVEPTYGKLFTYDGKADRLREVEVAARPGCPLCGERPEILDVEKQRYISRLCVA